MKRNFILANRRFFIYFLILSVAIIFTIKLFYIQIIKKSYYQSLAENNAKRRIVQTPERGLIFDRFDKLLAKNDSVVDIMIIPKKFKLSEKDTLEVCNYFNISKIELRNIIKEAKQYSNSKGSLFLEEVPFSILENLFQFKGLYEQTRLVRKYSTNYAANILGYIGVVNNNNLNKSYYESGDRIGKSGVDKSYEKILRGKKGVSHVIQDVKGNQSTFKNGIFDTLPIPGKSINLTIDLELQEFAEKIMKNYNGSVVALEPSTGEILCLVSSPSYNPSDFIGKKRNEIYHILRDDPNKPLFDRTILSTYAPGSTIKMLTALIGLEEKIINTGTKINCNFGWNYGAKMRVACHGTDHPPMNITNALAESCNAYFCELFYRVVKKEKTSELGLNIWSKYIKEFGFGDFLNNDLHAGVPGLVPDGKYYTRLYKGQNWGPSNCISLGIGQGELLVTPIQLANYTAILGNRGYFITPHIIKECRGNSTIKEYVEFQLIKKRFREINNVSISKKYFEYVIKGMERAIEGVNGTAKKSRITNLKICGKTGTVENYKKRIKQKDHSVFTAFSPKKNPKIAIAVYIENGGDGGDVAAPIANLCIEKYINRSIDLSFRNKPYFDLNFKNYILKCLKDE